MLDINIKVILRLMTYNYLYGPHVQLSHVDAELSHTQVVLPVDDVLPPAPPPPPLPQPDRITRSMKQNKTLLSTFPSPPILSKNFLYRFKYLRALVGLKLPIF